jgi:hypothetical protein
VGRERKERGDNQREWGERFVVSTRMYASFHEPFSRLSDRFFFNASSAGAGPREIDRTANRCGTAGGVRLPGGNKKERRAALAGPESCRGRGLVRATAQARRHVGLWQHG